eukprot:TRINITY_DN27916_c1_g2_i1.p1 TRINITY_DN27916_c1_g2~~TRINITY_DN27916_c1_g2_i1.p1  ORF type:complete len:132 (+),score=12.57 TRINITY_DN27916_c1_g2_i1:127-522(+)
MQGHVLIVMEMVRLLVLLVKEVEYGVKQNLVLIETEPVHHVMEVVIQYVRYVEGVGLYRGQLHRWYYPLDGFIHRTTQQEKQGVSSGQTLGVKAQRFRGHTGPHRNVKEKKSSREIHPVYLPTICIKYELR